MYGLPHPLSLLQTPPNRTAFKKLAGSLVMDFWEQKLRQQVLPLPSLGYLKAEYCSLNSPHPLTWTAGSNPHEVHKAVVQAKMLSGRYQTAALTSHWSNRSSHCQAPCCFQVDETLEHILVMCPYYTETRQKLVRLWLSSDDHNVKHLAFSVLSGPPENLVGFLLDASNHPLIINMAANYGPELLSVIFHLTRTWCYSIHRERLKLLKIFSFD